jgi:2-amino-4-hydroxy-6-hydroxymethyldihydropteridine pyrophosphokinase
MNEVILGLGSNIDPEQNLPEALRRLSGQVEIVAVSSLWKTVAVGSAGPVFLNAAARVLTGMDRDALKTGLLLPLEASLGRIRSADKNAPRPIDLDILVFNGEVLDDSIFKLDHLILPLAELLPQLCDAQTGKTLAVLAVEHCCKPTAVRVGSLIY